MKKFILFVAACLLVGISFSQNIVAESSFEGGSPSTAWTEYSTNFGTPLCDVNCGTCGGPCAPHSGGWYAWFGGTSSLEEGELSQFVTIPTGTSATLTFWVMVPVGASAALDTLGVWYGTDNLFTVTNADTTNFAAYTQVVVDMTPYLGTSDSLVFYGIFTSMETTNILIDDITLSTYTSVGMAQNHLLEGIEVFPNPATEHVYVNINSPKTVDITISVYDMNAKMVINESYSGVDTRKIDLNTAHLSKGTYYLVVNNGSENLSHKIVIE